MDRIIPVIVTKPNGRTDLALFYAESSQLKLVDTDNPNEIEKWYTRWFSAAANAAEVYKTTGAVS